jgi:hypothetical protein
VDHVEPDVAGEPVRRGLDGVLRGDELHGVSLHQVRWSVSGCQGERLRRLTPAAGP